MSETRKPTPEFDETLAQFPDLARARELYIDLFKDNSPLVNLGYNSRQIEYAVHTLLLLQGEGEVNVETRSTSPYLVFKNPDNNSEEDVYINCLPSKQGFYLGATRDEIVNQQGNSSFEEMLLRIIVETAAMTLSSLGGFYSTLSRLNDVGLVYGSLRHFRGFLGLRLQVLVKVTGEVLVAPMCDVHVRVDE